MERIIDNKNGTYSFERNGQIIHTGKWGDNWKAPKATVVNKGTSTESTVYENNKKNVPRLNLFDFSTPTQKFERGLSTAKVVPTQNNPDITGLGNRINPFASMQQAPSQIKAPYAATQTTPIPYAPKPQFTPGVPGLSTIAEDTATKFQIGLEEQKSQPIIQPKQEASIIPKANADEGLDNDKIKRFIDFSRKQGKSKEDIYNAYKKGIEQGIFNKDIIKTQQEPTQDDGLNFWQKYIEPLGSGFTEPLAQATYFNERYLNPSSLFQTSEENAKRAELAAQQVRGLTQEPGMSERPGYDIGKFAGEIAMLEGLGATGQANKINSAIVDLSKKYSPNIVKNILSYASKKAPVLSKFATGVSKGIVPASQYQILSEGNLNPTEIGVNAALLPSLVLGKDIAVGTKNLLKTGVEYGVSALSKVSKETIDFIKKNPDLVKQGIQGKGGLQTLKDKISEITKSPEEYQVIINDINNNISGVKSVLDETYNKSKFGIVSKIDETIKNYSDELSGLGQGYNDIKENPIPIAREDLMGAFKSALELAGVKFTKKGGLNFSGTSLTKTTDQPVIDKAIAEISDVLRKKKTITTTDGLNIRQRLSTLLKDKEMKGGNAIISKIRQGIDNFLKNTHPDIASLDAQYSGKIKELTDLKGLFTNNKGELKDNIPSIIDNLLKPNNKPKLDKWKKYIPDLESQLNEMKNTFNKSKLLKPTTINSKNISEIDKIVPGTKSAFEKATKINEQIKTMNKLSGNIESFKQGSLNTNILKNPEQLAELEKMIPGATTMLKVERAVQDYNKSGGVLSGAAVAGLGASVVSGNITGALTSLMVAGLSNPKVVVTLAMKSGQKEAVINNVLNKIKNNIKLDANDFKVIGAIDTIKDKITGQQPKPLKKTK